MELYYYNRHADGIRNFGDDLNPWLWQRLLPDLAKLGGSNSLFVGIGTIISQNLNSHHRDKTKVIFSSGYGYGEVPHIDSSWKFICVRGPLTAARLHLPPETAVTDGAILLNRVVTVPSKKTRNYGYMPHISMAKNGGDIIGELCKDLGINYIDPSTEIEDILSAIRSCEVIITEAMHGAIAAEALRTPWIPVVTSHVINKFKWVDWCKSLQLDYHPIDLIPLWRPENIFSQVKLCIKKRIFSSQLKLVMQTGKPIIAKENIFASKLQVLEERLEEFRSIYHY